MVGAAAAKAALAGLKTESYAFEKTAWPELYYAATPEMKEHNATRCDSQVTTQLRKAFPPIEGRHFWFKGAIDQKLATELYLSAQGFYNHKEGKLIIEYTEGKLRGTTSVPGFHDYVHHPGKHDPAAQLAATAFFSATMLTRATWSKKMWPELYAVYKAAKAVVDPDDSAFEVVCGHMLFCWSRAVCWEYHQDSKEINIKGKTQKVDLSVILELSDSGSSVEFAGNTLGNPEIYEKPGALVAFDSNVWHRSGTKYANTVMVAFFFKLKKKGAEGAAAASS
jgi:hypothetical protein